MSLIRFLLLEASENRWLRERAVRHPLARRAVARFMPGESVDEALAAAEGVRARGIGAVLTRLGESVTDLAEAGAVTAHYLDVLERLRPAAASAEISVKPTQLGLDIDASRCRENLLSLVCRAREAGTYVWIDMEQSRYVDATLRLCLDARAEGGPVGVCVQAYLRRTPADMDALAAAGAGIRLVKGAYAEPAGLAFPRKADVDAAYLALAERMLAARAAPPPGAAAGRIVFGTHDARLIGLIDEAAARLGLARSAYEYHLLYGIQRAEQERMAAAGRTVRVLISYGTYWFPWYMRRLAERPANLLFVARTLFAR